jgi:taurine transport system ATP-binding protein
VLRLVAGFEEAAAGHILLGDRDISTLAPAARGIGMVFQHYALFPHMTVADNIAYPLKRRKQGRAEIEARVAEVLELVRLAEYGERYPRQLSGGQQQRVALARAISFRPSLLLMDEPLGALDELTREKAQELILGIWQRTGKTVFFITHSVEEALFMGTKLIVMSPRPGRITHRFDLPFSRRFLDGTPARKIKASAEFIALREEVLGIIFADEEQAA